EGSANGSSTSCCTTTCTLKAAGTACRPSAGSCDVAETCTGSSGSCPADGFLSSSTVCRAAADECDLAENCPGNGPNCPADAKKASGTACASDGNPCTLDQCNGTNVTCQHPAGNAGTVCRASAGACDVAVTCSGGRMRPGGELPGERTELPRRREDGERHRVHLRRQPLHARPVRRDERDLPAPGGERRDGVPRGGRGVRRGRELHGLEHGL